MGMIDDVMMNHMNIWREGL